MLPGGRHGDALATQADAARHDRSTRARSVACYDVVVSLDGRAPRVQHLVPAQQQDLVFAFDDDAKAPIVEPRRRASRGCEATNREGCRREAVVGPRWQLKISSNPCRDRGRWPCDRATHAARRARASSEHEITSENEEQGIQLTRASRSRPTRHAFFRTSRIGIRMLPVERAADASRECRQRRSMHIVDRESCTCTVVPCTMTVIVEHATDVRSSSRPTPVAFKHASLRHTRA